MPVFVQSLERRFLLSDSPVTGVMLAADYGQIVADAGIANGALKTLAAELKSDNAIFAKDLKTLPKTNATLLAQLKADEAGANKTLAEDLGALLKPATALAKKSAIAGNQLTTKSSAALIAKATADSTALGNVTSTPLANLTAALGGTIVTSDLNALTAANPGDDALAAHVATATGQVSTQQTAISNAANQFVTDVANLNTDLSSVISAAPSGPTGTSGNVIPELGVLLPQLSGSATYTRGSNPWGSADNLNIEINAVDGAGNITGNLSGGFATDYVARSLLHAKVNSKGKFSAKLITSLISIATISGQFSIDQTTGTVTLNGTFKDGGTAGNFTASS